MHVMEDCVMRRMRNGWWWWLTFAIALAGFVAGGCQSLKTLTSSQTVVPPFAQQSPKSARWGEEIGDVLPCRH